MSTVAKKVIMGSGAVAGAYEIDQSLIFSSINDYLQRSPSSAGNRRTFTLSYWVKITTLAGASRVILSAGTDNTDVFHHNFESGGTPDDALRVVYYASSAFQINLTTNRVFRDPSAWYHIVLAIDTTQGTAANRVKIYVNGVQETSFATSVYPNQNLELNVNNTVQHRLGQYHGTDFPLKSYLAETHFIDGAAKAPSDFGETNSDTGQWIPKEYSGSYGTNGFYLKFVSGAIGTDSSGNSNTFGTTNLANTDVVIDTPTNNFATLNPIPAATSGMVLSEGNLHGVMRASGVANAQQAVSTIAMPVGSGKWYWEMRQAYPGLGFLLGITPTSEDPILGSTGNLGYNQYNASGGKQYATETRTSYGTAWFTSGQTYIISCYYDSDNGKIGFYLNGTDQGFAFTNVVASTYFASFRCGSGGTGSAPTAINFGQNGTFGGAVTAQGNAGANSIGDFYYAPPSGYKALCTANLPDPAIPLPSAQFNTVLYTGNAGTQSISGVGFQPDWVWAKNRSRAGSNGLFDAVRGAGKSLESDAASAERTQSDSITSFNSDGFSLGDNTEAGPDVNYVNNDSYVSWNWKANGAGSTDTSGDINGVVSANPTAGFSIVTWTGTGTSAPNANATVPHGLGVVPDFVWYKSRVGSSWENWIHSSIISGNKRMLLQSTAAVSSINTNYLLSGEIATSSMISNNGHTTSQPVVAYCFASKPGFSKIGVYTGNGNADGPFVNTGFKPAWLMYKIASTTVANGGDWGIRDLKRDPANVSNTALYANLNAAEGTTSITFDILSNGFKARSTNSDSNQSGQTFLYIAFAESPFKTSNAH